MDTFYFFMLSWMSNSYNAMDVMYMSFDIDNGLWKCMLCYEYGSWLWMQIMMLNDIKWYDS
jgi:hypothetical protein